MSSSQGVKRCVDSHNNDAKRHAPRSVNECARCGRVHLLHMFTVTTVHGMGPTPLCEPCASWNGDASTPLFVLDVAEQYDGLPLIADHMSDTDKLGTLAACVGGERRCMSCASRAWVIKCHPLHWGSPTANAAIKLFMCGECRRCDECGDSVQRGDGIDVTVGGERLCERCAMWCEWCEAFFPGGDDDEIGEHFQENAFNGDGVPLCKRQCAHCQEEDAVVAHPRSDRRYCRQCTLDDAWADEADEKRWPEMKARLM